MLIIARSRRSGRTIRKTRRRRIGLQDLHRRYAFAKNWRLLRSPVFFWEITLPRDALERRVPKGLTMKKATPKKKAPVQLTAGAGLRANKYLLMLAWNGIFAPC
jgi:hypothetical protein